MIKDKNRTPVAHTLFTICRKCKMELEHRVLFHNSAGTVEAVKCLTCSSEHKYHPEKKPGAGRAAATAGKTIRAGKKDMLKDFETVAEKLKQKEAVPYRMTGAFKENDVIDHDTFGRGLVIRVSNQKMEVVFSGGTRLLACERQPL